jgi:CRP/FNR family transcriptional regulator
LSAADPVADDPGPGRPLKPAPRAARGAPPGIDGSGAVDAPLPPGTVVAPGATRPGTPRDEVLAAYPSLADVPPHELDAALRATALVDVPRGAVLFREGDPCRAFPFVLDGDVSVARGTPDGRSIELYRVGPGEVCLLSTSCAFSDRLQVAHAVAAAPTRLWPAPPDLFLSWMARPAFRRFVFGVFGERLADLMGLAEAVAFQRMDQRLAAALLGHGRALHTTHQQLADALGTVREIVSRLLKRFEQRGWIALGRERIEIVDPAALRTLADGGTPAAD